MELKHLTAVERWTGILAVAVVLGAVLLVGRKEAFGASVGAGLMALNAYLLRRVAARVERTAGRPGAVLLLFNLKLAFVIGLVYLLVRTLHVDPLSFVIGISVLPVAIVIVAVRHQLRDAQPAPPSEETHG